MEASLELTDDDVRLMLKEIERFARRSMGPLVERPERAIAAEQLDELTRQAATIGLLNFESEPAAGLWENLHCDWAAEFSSCALHRVAEFSAGIAFHFHQLALSGYVCRQLGIDAGKQTVACIQGTYGLARGSLARLLKGHALSEEDQHTLRDYFVTCEEDDDCSLLFQAGESWQRLLVPRLDAEFQLGWVVFERETLNVTAIPHSHGLDETRTWRWKHGGEKPLETVHDPETSLALYGNALNVNAQALMAIASGTLQKGYRAACEYAGLRIQGGQRISEHAAVRQMLAHCTSSINIVELLLQQLAQLPISLDSLGKVFAVRAQVHNLLCAAANDALQVFGGLGYLPETGLEKIVRDNNHLRLLCGTSRELMLFLAEWESEYE